MCQTFYARLDSHLWPQTLAVVVHHLPRDESQRRARSRIAVVKPPRPGCSPSTVKTMAARLLAVRRILAIFLLTLLPLQLSWGAVASYCGHEEQTDTAHFGHHQHEHQAEVSGDARLVAELDVLADINGDKTPNSLDLDCGFCHSYCGAMLTLPLGSLGMPMAASPSASLDKAGGAHPPARPERPQWLPLA